MPSCNTYRLNLGFSYLGCGLSLHGCSSKAQPLLLTLDEGYLLTTALPDLQRGIAPLGPLVPEKARDFQKNICFCFIDYAKAFDCVDHHKLWKILKEMGIPDHLICLLRNLYAGQEAAVRTGHGIILVPNRKRSTSRLYIVTLLI